MRRPQCIPVDPLVNQQARSGSRDGLGRGLRARWCASVLGTATTRRGVRLRRPQCIPVDPLVYQQARSGSRDGLGRGLGGRWCASVLGTATTPNCSWWVQNRGVRTVPRTRNGRPPSSTSAAARVVGARPSFFPVGARGGLALSSRRRSCQSLPKRTPSVGVRAAWGVTRGAVYRECCRRDQRARPSFLSVADVAPDR